MVAIKSNCTYGNPLGDLFQIEIFLKSFRVKGQSRNKQFDISLVRNAIYKRKENFFQRTHNDPYNEST